MLVVELYFGCDSNSVRSLRRGIRNRFSEKNHRLDPTCIIHAKKYLL